MDGLDASLDRPLPERLMAGYPSAFLCVGRCSHSDHPVAELTLLVGGERHAPDAVCMPRDDASEYLSGFWATLPVKAREPGSVEVVAEARLVGGGRARATLGSIEVITPPPRVAAPADVDSNDPLIAICMATYNSDPDLFRVQVDSIRDQTDTNWMCVISDDCSDRERFEDVQSAVAGDHRFVVTRSETRLGFYRNFERLLALAPAEAELVALADHDDRWYPNKLAELRAGLGDAELAYSDLRLVDAAGNVRSESFWEGRRNNYESLASLLVSNTVAGAACLIRRRAVDRALPFPEGPGWDFHDHWLALIALSLGRIAYVDRPLYDYVQHPGAVLGHVVTDSADSGASPRGGIRDRVAASSGFLARWRRSYFTAYLQRRLLASVLMARCEDALTPRKRRALRLMTRADTSPLAFGWLASRPLRAVMGKNETLGVERLLARGIIWRHLMRVRKIWKRPGGPLGDASLPSYDSKSLGTSRRRWLAR